MGKETVSQSILFLKKSPKFMNFNKKVSLSFRSLENIIHCFSRILPFISVNRTGIKIIKKWGDMDSKVQYHYLAFGLTNCSFLQISLHSGCI